MKTNFRPAYIKDFAACWKVIDQARQSMIESGRHQWTEEYPSEKDIRKRHRKWQRLRSDSKRRGGCLWSSHIEW